MVICTYIVIYVYRYVYMQNIIIWYGVYGIWYLLLEVQGSCNQAITALSKGFNRPKSRTVSTFQFPDG